MKEIVNRWQFIALIIMLVVITSCDKDDPKQPNPGGKGNVLVMTTIKNTGGTTGVSYMQLISRLSGSVDNTNAIQIPYAQPVQVLGQDIFVFPDFMPTGPQQLQKYTRTENKLQKIGELDLPPGSGASNITKVNDQKAYLGMFSIGKVWIINPQTMKKIGEINFNKYAYGDNVAETGFGIIRDNKYYMPLIQSGANYLPYKDRIRVEVAVVDIKTDKIVKITSETTSKLSFPTRPMLKHMIFMNEKKDIYIACTGFFGYIPGLNETGFVCIPAGKTEIDPSKSWDISKVDIEGTKHKEKDGEGKEKELFYRASAVYNSYYLGNGKLVAYVCIQKLSGENSRTSRNTMAVLIDMNDKTIKKIEGIPLTDSHTISINKFNNLIAFGAYGKDKVGYFTYDPASGKVEQAIKTIGNPSYLHVFE